MKDTLSLRKEGHCMAMYIYYIIPKPNMPIHWHKTTFWSLRLQYTLDEFSPKKYGTALFFRSLRTFSCQKIDQHRGFPMLFHFWMLQRI